MRVEERKNIKKAVAYLTGAIVVGAVFLYVGVPTLARFAVFLGSFKKTSSSGGDDIPPAPPRLAPAEEFTKSDLTTIKGFSEQGVDVELFLNGDSTKKVVADDSGEFLFSDIKLASGSNQLYVIATDGAKNESGPSGILKIFLDQINPALTVDEPKDGQVFSGQGNKNISVKGKSEADTEVKVNGRAALVNDDGNFEASLTLSDGEQEIKISASDQAGNTTEQVIKVTFNP